MTKYLLLFPRCYPAALDDSLASGNWFRPVSELAAIQRLNQRIPIGIFPINLAEMSWASVANGPAIVHYQQVLQLQTSFGGSHSGMMEELFKALTLN